MSGQESDGIDEALNGAMHVTVTAAARALEVLAREREARARDEEKLARAATREYRQAMSYGSSADEVTRLPPTEAQESYLRGVGLRVRPQDGELTIDEASAILSSFEARELARGDLARAQELLETLRAGGAAEARARARADRAEAVGLMAAADATERSADASELDPIEPKERGAYLHPEEETAAHREGERSRASEMREDAGQSYDSAERREAMAQEFDHIDNRAAVDARVRSDVAQGRSATEATKGAPGKAPKARKNRSGPQTSRTVQRAGQSR